MKPLLTALFLLGACAQDAPQAWVPQERDVLLHIMNRDALHKEYREAYKGTRNVGEGFARFPYLTCKPEPCRVEKCEIWVTPKGILSTTLLHELKHCDRRRYHK